jgi:hypothetical protein
MEGVDQRRQSLSCWSFCGDSDENNEDDSDDLIKEILWIANIDKRASNRF